MLKRLLTKRFFLTSGLGLLFLLIGATTCRASPHLVVLFPPDNIIVENEIISAVLKLEKGIFDSIRVVAAGQSDTRSKIIPVDSSSDRVCFSVTLTMGLNDVEFQGMYKDKVVETNGIKLFYQSDRFPRFRQLPVGLQRYYFHLPENVESCSGCHDMQPALRRSVPEEPQDSPCYFCHANNNGGNIIHKPAAKWTCYACHEERAGARMHTIPKPVQMVCFPCHRGKITIWNRKEIMHGPAAVGNCTLCHDPHAANRPGLLKIKAVDLCITCHQEKASGAHVIAGFYGKGHPVRGVPDPFEPEREFSCISCHDPHAGDTRNLLKHHITSLTQYCTICHKM